MFKKSRKKRTVSGKSFIPINMLLLFLAITLGYGNEPKRPYAVTKPASIIKEDGQSMWKTTVVIKAEKSFWWIKTAAVNTPLNARSCREDKSPGKKISKTLLNEIFLFPPSLRGEIGLFNVQIIPGKGFESIKDFPVCTYDADITFNHSGKNSYQVKGAFRLELTPGSAPIQVVSPESVAKTPITAPVTPVKEEPVKKPEPAAQPIIPPPPPIVKTPVTPPKVFQAEDHPEPDKVEISPEAVLAFNKTALVSPPQKEPEKLSSVFNNGLNAYKAGNFKSAIEIFSGIKVPKTKKRGVQERDEYVDANFYKGLALQKENDLKGAVSSYETVQQYEKYFPILSMNLGICYLELNQYAKAHKAFKQVIRDQSRIPPDKFDAIMQSTRYFWAVTWIRLYKAASDPDKKLYFKKTALDKWTEYLSWYEDDVKYKDAAKKALMYKASLDEN